MTLGGFDLELLEQIETRFARFIGPLAKILVRNAAKQATDVDQLCDQLAERLGSDEERMDFLVACLQLFGATPQASTLEALPSQPHRPRSGWDPAVLDEIEASFTRVMGPVAKVLVRRAAEQTRDVDELYARLAARLGAGPACDAFLATRHALPGALPKPPPSSLLSKRVAPGAGHQQDRPLTPTAIGEAQDRLAAHVGPIAKIMVEKAVMKAASTRSLYLLLAEHIHSEVERAQFLDSAGKP